MDYNTSEQAHVEESAVIGRDKLVRLD